MYRRELRRSVHAAAVAFAVVELISVAAVSVASPRLAPFVLALGVPISVASVGLARASRGRFRRHPESLGMALGFLPILTCVLNGLVMAELAPFAIAVLALVPLSFAIFVPLDRRRHLAWLGSALAVVLALIGAAALAGALRADLPTLAIVIAFGGALSAAANEMQLRSRVRMNRQLLAARSLYWRMQEHEADLRRQDDFLLMQQETLVVQQAELLRLNEELESIARLDGLTNLGNRLRLNEDLASLAGRIERSGGTAGILLLDLDRFKRLNDSAGHLAGDAALRGVADVLRKTSRVGDMLYRYGGEEFLVVLHDCDETVLELAGQRFLSAIAAAAMPHPDNAPWNVVTASAGAAELSLRTGVDVDTALRAADEALYQAKAHGRNRLEVHSYREPAAVVPIDQKRVAS